MSFPPRRREVWGREGGSTSIKFGLPCCYMRTRMGGPTDARSLLLIPTRGYHCGNYTMRVPRSSHAYTRASILVYDKYVYVYDGGMQRDNERANDITFSRVRHRLPSDRPRRQLKLRMRTVSVTSRRATGINISRQLVPGSTDFSRLIR